MCWQPILLLKEQGMVSISNRPLPAEVQDIHFRNITADSVGNAFMYTRLESAYSYSTLPADNFDLACTLESDANKVEPEEKGIPHFRDIHISNVESSMQKAINASGLKNHSWKIFIFKMWILMRPMQAVSFAKDWTGMKLN
jgi:hypothetical protein